MSEKKFSLLRELQEFFRVFCTGDESPDVLDTTMDHAKKLTSIMAVVQLDVFGKKLKLNALEREIQSCQNNASVFPDEKNNLYRNLMLCKDLNPYESLRKVFAMGATINNSERDEHGRTEAMYIMANTGVDGLLAFVKNGGRFNPDAQDIHGRMESMSLIVRGQCSPQRMRVFLENGGRFNPTVTDQNGWTEAMNIMQGDDPAECLKIYIENGGRLNPSAKIKHFETTELEISVENRVSNIYKKCLRTQGQVEQTKAQVPSPVFA